MAGASDAALEDLDGVEWYRLAHAYGVATDVPDLLRLAAGDDPKAAWSALRDLGDRLLRGDLVHTAAPDTARFLVRLAQAAPSADVRAGSLLLLTDLAGAREGDPATARQMLAVLSRNRAPLGRLLEDEEPAVRAATAGLAGHVLPPPADWALRLRGLRDAAPDELSRAAFAVAAALSEGRPPDRHDIDRAAGASYEVAVWKERELSGLLGLRISPSSAARLGARLARLAVEQMAEKK